MADSEDNSLRLSAQRALLGHVTPRLRAVSLDVEGHRVQVRSIFDGDPDNADRNAAACAGTEILADCPPGWEIAEDVVVCRAPAKMDHLRLLVYARSEDASDTDEEQARGS